MTLTLDDVGEWYPTIVSMARNVGGVEAQVYGVVWNYSRMKFGKCFATQAEIASKVGVSKTTVRRCLITLVEKGYLEFVENSVRYGTNVYRITGKAGLKTVAFDNAVPGDNTQNNDFDVDI